MVLRQLLSAGAGETSATCGVFSSFFHRSSRQLGSRRSLSDTTTASMKVFDRAVKRQQRDRAAAADPQGEYDYLREHIAAALVDRLEDISREFPRALDLGAHAGHIYRAVSAQVIPVCVFHVVAVDGLQICKSLLHCIPCSSLDRQRSPQDDHTLPR
ncbi:unnamed protein product [Sphacelaria rigidula]